MFAGNKSSTDFLSIHFVNPSLILKCEGSGNEITFPAAGTAYVVIRSGGFGNNTLGVGGVKMTNVEFRAKN